MGEASSPILDMLSLIYHFTSKWMCQAVGCKCVAQERDLGCRYKYASCQCLWIIKALMLKDIQGIACRKQREVFQDQVIEF